MNTLELVQKSYECFGKDDIAGLTELMADDVKWTTPVVENAPYGGSKTGKQSVSDFFRLLSESEDITRFEPLEFIVQDDKVAVLGEYAATVNSTGKSYETEWVHLFHIQDDKISSFHEFFDNAAATRAFQKSARADA